MHMREHRAIQTLPPMPKFAADGVPPALSATLQVLFGNEKLAGSFAQHRSSRNALAQAFYDVRDAYFEVEGAEDANEFRLSSEELRIAVGAL